MRVVKIGGFLILFFCLFVWNSYAQTSTRVNLVPEATGLDIISNNINSLKIQFKLSSYNLLPVNTGEGDFIRLVVGGFQTNYNEGLPELPELNKLIKIPAGAEIRIVLKSIKEKEIPLAQYGIQNKIFPSQPSGQKQISSDSLKFLFNKPFYSLNRFNKDKFIKVEEKGKIRGQRIAGLQISPFRYNPVSNILKVIYKADIEIVFENPDIEQDKMLKNKYKSRAFENTLSKILSYKTEETKSAEAESPVKYVILSDTIFHDILQPFIKWKTRKGFNVIELYTGENGAGTTREELKDTLKGIYVSATPENPAPTFLLIVGDVEQIPASQSSGQVTDLYYAEYDGNGDYLPDVFYGRLSARDTSELIPQINKIMEYEQYLFPDPSFLDEAVMIAGVDGSYASVWGNGQINYGTNYYFNPAHGINSHTYLHPESGSSSDSIIKNISDGVGFVNYTGHGVSNRWLNPEFNISDIDSLKNLSKYPLMIGNGCSTATFQLGNCLGEALVRAKEKGALGYMGCTNDSYWDEDYYWAVGIGPIKANPTYAETGLGMYDRVFHDNGEPETDWYTTQGQMMYAGNLAVTESNSTRSKYYWEIYTMLGDPSLMVYFSVPDPMVVNVPDTLPVGIYNLHFQCEQNAYAALSIDGKLLDATYTDASGVAILEFLPVDSVKLAELVITKQNRKPFIDTLNIVADNGPYVTYKDHILEDTAGNYDHLADWGEKIGITLTLENTGPENTGGVITKLSTKDLFIQLLDSIESYGTVNAHTNSTIQYAFQIKIMDSIPDQHMATMHLEITDFAGNNWDSYFRIKLNAPVLEIGKTKILDIAEGNGNNKLDPGEKADIQVEISNIGHSSTYDLTSSLITSNSYVAIQNETFIFTELKESETKYALFTVEIDSSAPQGTIATFNLSSGSENYLAKDSFNLPIGLIYESFESGDFYQYNWKNDSLYPWTIVSSSPYEGSFTAQSGSISHSRKSELSMSLEIFTDDTISFYRKISSENNYDFLRFYIDSVQVEAWSGVSNWALQEYPLFTGDHTLQWIYMKDGSVSRGEDKAWIDFIVFPDYTFTKFNIGPGQLITPMSGLNLTNSEDIIVEIKNFGSEPVDSLYAGYKVDGVNIVVDTIRSVLDPYGSLLHTFSIPADLSLFKEYRFEIFTILSRDNFRGNDTLTIIVENIPTIDVGVLSFALPAQKTYYTNDEPVSIWIGNFGTISVSEFPVFYSINDSILTSDFVDTLISAGDSILFIFSSTADLSDFQSYTISSYTQLDEDTTYHNDSVFILIDHHTSLKQVPLDWLTEISLFPNPARDFLNLSVKTTDEGEFLVRIMNLTGQVILEKKYYVPEGFQTIEIPINTLIPGPYLFTIYVDENVVVYRILKQ
ncbi:MAG: T9SS type A sorting domain-containing protein [Bacteroidales bacterium]|nr:T9SS type A sorting domain-containing protein [Bacteroidales bacterium]